MISKRIIQIVFSEYFLTLSQERITSVIPRKPYAAHGKAIGIIWEV